MADRPEPAFYYASKGMDSSTNPALLDAQHFARATNVQIKNQIPTTRPGFHTLRVDNSEEFKSLNVQGASFFNPAKGQSAQSFASDLSSIVVSAGGQKFHLVIEDARPGIATASVRNVTGAGLAHDPKWHLSYLSQCENYMIACDGNGDTWIWDGSSAPRFSKGFNTITPEESELPNGATVSIYAHGRICMVTDARRILTGNIIHEDGSDSSDSILKTSEQIYWASGAWFAPPSSMGNVLAAGILPEQNTQHGHGDIMFHCEDGVFSLNINVFPRTAWSDQVLVKHVLLDTGARGPYALCLLNGDQFFRSRDGIQSLRSAAAQPQQMGNPLHPISEQVNIWFDNDFEAYLDFASVSRWSKERRLFCTTQHEVEGFRRYARGICSLNFATAPVTNSGAWEGLWVLPPEAARPIQMVNGIFNRRDRLVVIAEDCNGENAVGEFGPDLTDDVRPDGSRRRISCQLTTREMSHEALFVTKAAHVGILYLRGIRGLLDWGVWVRKGSTGNWTYWRSGKIDARVEPTGDWSEQLQGGTSQDADVPLGVFPQRLRNERSYQFLVRWRGHCGVEGLRIDASPGDSNDGQTPKIPLQVRELEDLGIYQYDDFENASDSNRWEDLTPK